MQFTPEQEAVFESQGDIKINAVAGSGKTTTLIEYARRRNKQKILYIAFNKSVKEEAIQKFKGLNVDVQTAHSLAFRYMKTWKKQLKSSGYKSHELKDLLRIKPFGSDAGLDFMLASHVNKFATYFCNSTASKVGELDYRQVLPQGKARAFVDSNYQRVERKTREFLAMMHKGQIDITHDFYLKQFQLNSPALPYDIILFDEGQDASPVMLDVFRQQAATKVIVGDAHQQIYGWRYAVNSLHHVHFPEYKLTNSFRFRPDIAALATSILNWKKKFMPHQTQYINGRGTGTGAKTQAVIGRTNLGLLQKAIELVCIDREIDHIYFEGSIHSYTYANEGASLYDVLNLFLGHYKRIRNKLIRSMNTFEDLSDYAETTEDAELTLMVEAVKKYGSDLPGYIEELKDKHVADDQKPEAEMIFSTVHRAKGMEYDHVHLLDDFIDEFTLEHHLQENKGDPMIRKALNEEINILYVAVTRARNKLELPANLQPNESSISYRESERKHNNVEETFTGLHLHTQSTVSGSSHTQNNNSYSVDEIRKTHKNAYKKWTTEEDDALTEMFCEEASIGEIAENLGRKKGAVRSRIKKLELQEKYMDFGS